MAWHEWPLIVFTVLAQTSVGAFLVLATLMLTKTLSEEAETRLHKAMFGLWSIMGAGFLASVMHLGSPLRAMNALNMLGSSWLSNEIASGSTFFAFGGFFWLLSIVNKGSATIRKGLMIAAMVAGLVFMYSMIMVYMIDTVPTWYTGLTPASFILTMVVSGFVLAHALLIISNNNSELSDKVLPVIGLIGAFATVVVVMLLSVYLGEVQTSAVDAFAIIPEYVSIQAARLILLLFAVFIWLVPVIYRKPISLKLISMVFVLVLLSELIGRSVFYGMHMTAGV